MLGKLSSASLLVMAMLVIGGCCEKERQQLAELQLNKQDLEGQIQQLKGELDDKQAELAKCQDRLASLTGEREGLQRQLESMKNQPKLPTGWEVRKGMVMTSLPEAVLFAPGKADLKTSATSKLNTVIQQIRANFPGRDVYVVGHTDSDPIRRSKWQDTLELSRHRAAAGARFMRSHGMNPKQVIAAGVGEYRPMVSNSTSSGKMKNRRVEFWILKPM